MSDTSITVYISSGTLKFKRLESQIISMSLEDPRSTTLDVSTLNHYTTEPVLIICSV